jgi:hypothetical protein
MVLNMIGTALSLISFLTSRHSEPAPPAAAPAPSPQESLSRVLQRSGVVDDSQLSNPGARQAMQGFLYGLQQLSQPLGTNPYAAGGHSALERIQAVERGERHDPAVTALEQRYQNLIDRLGLDDASGMPTLSALVANFQQQRGDSQGANYSALV